MSFSKDSKQKLTAVAAVVIVALLGLNAFLIYNNMQHKEANEALTVKLDEAKLLEAEIEKQYYDALTELEAMKGKEENLNELIDQQKQELLEQKKKLTRLIRSDKDLKAARKQLADLNIQMEQYVVEITTLKEENAILAEANAQLTEQKSMLEGDLSKERSMNEELTTVKATLMSEKENLENVNANLSGKVEIASVIKVNNVNAQGYKEKASGKRKKRNSAKNVDYVQVCFDVTANEVTPHGLEQFFVRIINPLGETLAIEDLGSGITTNSKTGEEIRYTKIKELEYNNESQQACFLWDPNVPFSKGNYEIEVFNKGYLAGAGTFNLK
jgi:myosin heavy subunit